MHKCICICNTNTTAHYAQPCHTCTKCVSVCIDVYACALPQFCQQSLLALLVLVQLWALGPRPRDNSRFAIWVRVHTLSKNGGPLFARTAEWKYQCERRCDQWRCKALEKLNARCQEQQQSTAAECPEQSICICICTPPS